jgi:hypothetical protein
VKPVSLRAAESPGSLLRYLLRRRGMRWLPRSANARQTSCEAQDLCRRLLPPARPGLEEVIAHSMDKRHTETGMSTYVFDTRSQHELDRLRSLEAIYDPCDHSLPGHPGGNRGMAVLAQRLPVGPGVQRKSRPAR